MLFGQQSVLFRARIDDLSVSTCMSSIQRQSIEQLLAGHHRRLVGPGPARPALGYATGDAGVDPTAMEASM